MSTGEARIGMTQYVVRIAGGKIIARTSLLGMVAAAIATNTSSKRTWIVGEIGGYRSERIDVYARPAVGRSNSWTWKRLLDED